MLSFTDEIIKYIFVIKIDIFCPFRYLRRFEPKRFDFSDSFLRRESESFDPRSLRFAEGDESGEVNKIVI